MISAFMPKPCTSMIKTARPLETHRRDVEVEAQTFAVQRLLAGNGVHDAVVGRRGRVGRWWWGGWTARIVGAEPEVQAAEQREREQAGFHDKSFEGRPSGRREIQLATALERSREAL